MRLLLDTSVWLWLHTTPERVDAELRDVLVQESTVRHLSAASVWEMAIKHSQGKLQLPEPIAAWIAARLRIAVTDVLPINEHHALRAAALPPHHRDPFARMLGAQAQVEGLTLGSAANDISAYDVALQSPFSPPTRA